MSNSSRKVVSAITALVLLGGTAWAAAPAMIQGDVKGPDGKALNGADVRIQRKGGQAFAKAMKTDAKGRYVFKDLTVGSYDLMVSANGMAATAAQNVATTERGAVRVNFDLKNQTGKGGTAATKKKAKKMVWMPGETGSHIGGRWVEVADDGTVDDSSRNTTVTKQDSIRKMLGGGGMNPHGN